MLNQTAVLRSSYRPITPYVQLGVQRRAQRSEIPAAQGFTSSALRQNHQKDVTSGSTDGLSNAVEETHYVTVLDHLLKAVRKHRQPI